MQRKRIGKKLGINMRYTLTVCTLLLAVNAVLGFVMIRQSGSAMRNLIRRHMISVADTASALVDGDALSALTAEDAGSETWNEICGILTRVKDAQKDSDIKYIYLVRRAGDHYEYTVDPDPEEPAEFGSWVVDTQAQDTAWAGTSAVDEVAVEDEWGCFYTAWSPVRDSARRVIGMVGVDFAADWYDQQMSRHRLTVVLISALSLLVSIAIMSILTLQQYRRFRRLYDGLNALSGNVESLAETITGRENEEESETSEAPPETDSDSDIIQALGERIRHTQELLTEYIEYAQKQAFTDSLTGVGNRDAYVKCVGDISREIDNGTAAFAVTIIDINGLKSTNDNYGHECGDQIIMDTAMVISRIFGKKNIYRIGGDEFIAVSRGVEQEGLRESFRRLDSEIWRFNREEKRYAMTLSFSYGGTVYRPGVDASYKEVFKRADQAMYRNKAEYYRLYGSRSEHFDAEESTMDDIPAQDCI